MDILHISVFTDADVQVVVVKMSYEKEIALC